jgi:hypothetical protein
LTTKTDKTKFVWKPGEILITKQPKKKGQKDKPKPKQERGEKEQ